jgi:hypothetical protein
VWKLYTSLSIDALDSMFGHKRLMRLFDFIFIVDSMTLVVITFVFIFLLQRQAVAEGADDDEEDLEEIRARLAKVRS